MGFGDVSLCVLLLAALGGPPSARQDPPPPPPPATAQPQPAAGSSKAFNPDISVIGNFIAAAGKNDVSPPPPFQLSDAQWAIARSLGDASWPALVRRLATTPLVPVRGIVVFPGQRVVLHIGRSRSA